MHHVLHSLSIAAIVEWEKGTQVIDIGCGGGIAAFALVPPASFVIGIDHQQEMLDMFKDNADQRNISSSLHLGLWPAVEIQPCTEILALCLQDDDADIMPFVEPVKIVDERDRHFFGQRVE